MSTIDNILELLDNSLEWPNVGVVPKGTSWGSCWKCQIGRPSPESPSGLCERCRKWMACESDEEPARLASVDPSFEEFAQRFRVECERIILWGSITANDERIPVMEPLWHSGEWLEAQPEGPLEEENPTVRRFERLRRFMPWD